jgi:hypothetical protein
MRRRAGVDHLEVAAVQSANRCRASSFQRLFGAPEMYHGEPLSASCGRSGDDADAARREPEHDLSGLTDVVTIDLERKRALVE